MSTRYLSAAETAKLIRQALKEAFPGVKFGVRSHTYAGGASVRVSWTDGPNSRQVESVAKSFQGSYFDGSIDYKGSLNNMIDGQEVSFGADFVFCERSHSNEAIARAISATAARFAGNLRDDNNTPTVDDWKNGRVSGRLVPHSNGIEWYSEIATRLAKVSDRFAPAKSNTASRVIFLGNDGYSQHGALDSASL